MKKILLPIVIVFLLHSNCFSESKFLNFSDVHFDPFYDTTLVQQLTNSDYKEWETIFLSSKITGLSTYGSDSNFPLFISALEEMKSKIQNPDFIIITGDFMSHDFNENFEKYSGTKDVKALNSFIKKTIRFTKYMIAKYFSSSQIFATVGNDDAYCAIIWLNRMAVFSKCFIRHGSRQSILEIQIKNFQRHLIKGVTVF